MSSMKEINNHIEKLKSCFSSSYETIIELYHKSRPHGREFCEDFECKMRMRPTG